MTNKELNQENFEYLYSYYLAKGLRNKQIAKKLGISIRSLYYYKKGVVPTKESKKLTTKRKNIARYKKRKETIRKRKIKRPPPPPPKKKIIEVQYIFKATCRFDSPPFKSEHFFTWIGKPGLSDDVILKFGKLQHEFWKHHELKDLIIWDKINVYKKD